MATVDAGRPAARRRRNSSKPVQWEGQTWPDGCSAIIRCNEQQSSETAMRRVQYATQHAHNWQQLTTAATASVHHGASNTRIPSYTDVWMRPGAESANVNNSTSCRFNHCTCHGLWRSPITTRNLYQLSDITFYSKTLTYVRIRTYSSRNKLRVRYAYSIFEDLYPAALNITLLSCRRL